MKPLFIVVSMPLAALFVMQALSSSSISLYLICFNGAVARS